MSLRESPLAQLKEGPAESPRPSGELSQGPILPQITEWTDSVPAHLRELVRHRELLYLIAQREIKVRYRQTVLGVLWAVLQPLSLMLVLTVFFSWFIGIGTDGIPYPLFSYSGLLPWTFFSTALLAAGPSLIGNSHIITRIYFPREIVPLSSVLAAVVDFVIASVIFLGLLVFYGVGLTWNALYFFPLLLIQVVFTTAASLLLSGLIVLYRDVRFTLPLLIQTWMFMTPVLYPLSVVPEPWRGLYLLLNPIAVVVDGYRRALIQAQAPDHVFMASAAGISLMLALVSYRLFKALERQFADVV